MAVERKRSSGLHLVTRLVGLTGLVVAVIGGVLWNAAPEIGGPIILVAGAALVGVGLLGELRNGFDLVSSRRGALGSNVALQIVLAIVLVAGVNVLSFFN